MGGLVTFRHLWFLYYLIWIYALTLVCRPVVKRIIRDGSAYRRERGIERSRSCGGAVAGAT